MRPISRWSVSAAAFVAGLSMLALSSRPASALTLTGISDASLAALTGAQVGSLTTAFDFAPTAVGGDGTVTSSVFEGAGDAASLFVYVYQIDLFDAAKSSVTAISGMAFDFTTPEMIAFGSGSLEAFTVTDDGGSVGPQFASHTDTTARFFFVFDQIGNGETSHQFGMFSASLPGTAIATMLDSGAGLVLEPTVLSNGASPVPEPHAAVLFGVGCVTVVSFGRRKPRST